MRLFLHAIVRAPRTGPQPSPSQSFLRRLRRGLRSATHFSYRLEIYGRNPRRIP